MHEIFNTRYVKLRFTIVAAEDCRMPKHKVSALRGGMGEMLLRAHCIRDRNCEKCDFESECIVRRMMYSKFENPPPFVTSGESMGYVLECESRKEYFSKGEELDFVLILFGKTIVYFSQFLMAFHDLGQNGLGKDKAGFLIQQVRNTKGVPILEGSNVYMGRYRVERLSDYITYRMESFEKQGQGPKVIRFTSPLSLKHDGEVQKQFRPEALVRSIQRRLYMLGCFEDIPEAEDFYYSKDQSILHQFPEVISQHAEQRWVERYSSTQDTRMKLKGIEGFLELKEPLSGELLRLFIAGELVHIGKNTSFGFGRYRLK